MITAVLNQVVPGRAPTDHTGLAGADLNQIELRGANLRRARLDGSMLIEADLTKADLRGASLSGCVLTNATLVRVDARKADLGAATLRWADAAEAKLRGVRLRMANADDPDTDHPDALDLAAEAAEQGTDTQRGAAAARLRRLARRTPEHATAVHAIVDILTRPVPAEPGREDGI